MSKPESDMAVRPDLDYYEHIVIEPATLHHLADAAAALMQARAVTEHGFVSDYCDNAIREIRQAIRHFGEAVTHVE